MHYDQIEVDPNLEHQERSVLEKYSIKLIVGDVPQPDPMTLKSGWKGKKTGITCWPSVYYFDIATFMGLTQPDFIKRMES